MHHGTVVVETSGPRTYDITTSIEREIAAAGVSSGLATVFCQHTSCSLVIMENASPDARRDLERFFNKLVPPDCTFEHNLEGPDDMPSHIKTVLTRTSESIPIIGARLQLGTWQGVYLWEHRTISHKRTLIVTVIGE